MAITSIKSFVISVIMISLCDIKSVTVSACRYSTSQDCPGIAVLKNTTDLVYDSQIRIENTQTKMVNLLQMLYQNIPDDHDCADIAARGPLPSGSYTIQPWGVWVNLRVFCDMDTDDGGWIVFQRRFDGSVDFNRGWDDYEQGFGFPDGEFWLGLGNIHRLVQQGTWELRVDLQGYDSDGNDTAYAKYSFSIGDAASNYTLSVGAYSGTAGDSLLIQNTAQFSTPDRNNDGCTDNCADRDPIPGGWWYVYQPSNWQPRLNDQYQQMIWFSYDDGNYFGALRSEMKIRRIR